MARFLVTYHGSSMPHDPEAMAKARQAFLEWAARTGDALVDQGAPVASTATLSSEGRRPGPAGDPVNGWSVVEGADVDAVTQLLRDHPFLSRGGVLQINEPVEL